RRSSDAQEGRELVADGGQQRGEPGRRRSELGPVEVAGAGGQRRAVAQEGRPYLDEVAVAQRRTGDGLAVDEGAVLGGGVLDRPSVPGASEEGVPRRDGGAREAEVEEAETAGLCAGRRTRLSAPQGHAVEVVEGVAGSAGEGAVAVEDDEE